MTTSQKKLLSITTFAVVAFIGMGLLFGDMSSTATGFGTEDEFGLGITGWLVIVRNSEGWHVEEFHFWLMLLELAGAVGVAAALSRGYSFVARPAPTIKKRIYFPASVICGIVALALNSAGYALIDEYSSRSAHAMSAAYMQNVKYVGDAETTRLLHLGNILKVFGLICTLSGFICLAVALIRREKGWYLLLLGLLIIDIMLLMML
jgi:hypothetical protein